LDSRSTRQVALVMINTSDAIVRQCRDCHSSFAITASEQKRIAEMQAASNRVWELPTRCRSCRVRKRDARLASPVSTIICSECRAPFALTAADVAFYRTGGQPTRCAACRHARQHGVSR
jgi:putative zinc ribbon protein